MSLLEDVFLEDEAGEAQELERVIEGDDFDERPRSRSDSDENSAKEDEAEEEKTRVDPTSAKQKRVIKNPRFVLNPARLTGPRGIQVVTEHFKDFKFKGKGHEKEDLDLVLKKLEHWAYRLYPKFQFEDCLKKIETLGKKRAVSVHLHRIRMDEITSEETVVQKDSSDDEATPAQEPEEDEFDKLLQQQIEIARTTPAPNSNKKTQFHERTSMMPKATSSPSINDEQRERMLRNRRMAEERRLARLKHNTSQENLIENGVSEPAIKINDVSIEKMQKPVIDSSDEDVTVSNLTNDINKSDTIELDNNGAVVTKSPKRYVPAKKHKTNSDVTMNRNVTIDIHDSNNVIVELDDNGKVIAKPKKSVPAKRLNKSRIDSSDDDDDNGKIVSVDVDKHNDASAIFTNNINNKSDEILIINEPIVENRNDTPKKHNRSIIDSSDSEDEAVVMNESITVDIHDSNKRVTDDCNKYDTNVTNLSNNTDTNENDAYLKETNSEISNDIVMEYSKNIEKVTDDSSMIKSSCNNVIDCSNSMKLSDPTEVLIEKAFTSNETQDTDKDNENATELNDEIMDVDFSDDF